MHTTIYLPATYPLQIKIKHLVWLTLKVKSMAFYYTILAFYILFHLTNSLSINLIMVVIWYWNKRFYFLFHTKAGFSSFYIGLLFTHTACTGWILYVATDSCTCYRRICMTCTTRSRASSPTTTAGCWWQTLLHTSTPSNKMSPTSLTSAFSPDIRRQRYLPCLPLRQIKN